MAEHDAQEKKLLATVLKADIVNQTCFSDMLLQCWRAFLMAQSVELCSGRVTAAEDYA